MDNKVAIYCRLSKDDEQCGDSISIETQKMMLTKYCSEHNFEIFEIYVDDGYSGLNFNRPSFKRLIEDLENGKFNIVITKDLSRLGRDYIQTGYYIDVYFVTKHIRYIAVNDGIDTQYDNNDIAPFKNILNDMYAKDLSRKVKSAKLQRAQNGLYISAQPPYGYKVNPLNRNQLIVDEEPATIVKLIFDLAEEGNSYSEISRVLESRQITSPSAYKAMNGDTRFMKYAEDKDQIYKWPYQTIKSIITNPVYVGDMVNHKVETVNYKTKERVRIPIDEQIVVQNRHEAIIERYRFQSINERMSGRRRPNYKYDNIFKGILFCAECNTELQLISRKLKYETKPMFRCQQHISDCNICTHNHFIYYDELCTEIKKQLDNHIASMVDSVEYNKLCNIILDSICSRALDIKKAKCQRDLISLNKRIKEYYKTYSINSNILQNPSELDVLTNNQKTLMREITEATAMPLSDSQRQLIMNLVESQTKDFLQSISLNPKTLTLFIKKITIGHLEKTPTGIYQTINIYYRF